MGKDPALVTDNASNMAIAAQLDAVSMLSTHSQPGLTAPTKAAAVAKLLG